MGVSLCTGSSTVWLGNLGRRDPTCRGCLMMLFGSRRNFESVGWEKGLALPGRSPWNRTTPTGPSPDVQAIVFLGFGEPTGSTASVQLVLGRRGPPPGCPRVERERPHTRGGFPDTAAALSSLRKCTFPPHTTSSCLYISPFLPPPDAASANHPLSKKLLCFPGGWREGKGRERDAEAEGGGGCLPVAHRGWGQEGICRQWGRGLCFQDPKQESQER